MMYLHEIIKACNSTIILEDNLLNIIHKNESTRPEKEIKFNIKVLKDIITNLESLKMKYEDKFECNERDYK